MIYKKQWQQHTLPDCWNGEKVKKECISYRKAKLMYLGYVTFKKKIIIVNSPPC